MRPMIAEDLAGMTEAEQAYCICSQLAVACAVMAGLAGVKNPKPEDFMLQFKDKTKRTEAYQSIMELAKRVQSDAPVMVERRVER